MNQLLRLLKARRKLIARLPDRYMGEAELEAKIAIAKSQNEEMKTKLAERKRKTAEVEEMLVKIKAETAEIEDALEKAEEIIHPRKEK
jgi:hypothetical protein